MSSVSQAADWTIREDPEHLPDFPVDGGMRHLGLVNPDGEVVATVWNHHDSHGALRRAEHLRAALAAMPEPEGAALARTEGEP